MRVIYVFLVSEFIKYIESQSKRIERKRERREHTKHQIRCSILTAQIY